MSHHDASAAHHSPPEARAALLADDEWRVAVRALGLDRLRELHSMMFELTPTFRRAVVRHLSDPGGDAPGRTAMPAIARSVRELRGGGVTR